MAGKAEETLPSANHDDDTRDRQRGGAGRWGHPQPRSGEGDVSPPTM